MFQVMEEFNKLKYLYEEKKRECQLLDNEI